MTKRDLFLNAMIACLSVIITLVIIEGFVRINITTDVFGQRYFLNVPLLPLVSPDAQIQKRIETYTTNPHPYLRYDSALGWRISPNAESENGLYHANRRGYRGPEAEGNATRTVSLFGDSFIHGDDVPYDETIGAHLKTLLDQTEITTVRNFGVPGYGIDQAYLRWQEEHVRNPADITVIGVQPENCRRNLNLLRAFYYPETTIPFSKPRFVAQNDMLVLINSPTISLDTLPDEVRKLEHSSLFSQDYFLRPHRYEKRWYLNSTLAALLITYLDRKEDIDVFTDPLRPEGRLCLDILETFVANASRDSSVILLHIPREEDVRRVQKTGLLGYESFLGALAISAHLVDPIQVLAEHPLDNLFVGHYSNTANRIIAELLADAILHSTYDVKE